jgi:hypothetical protein
MQRQGPLAARSTVRALEHADENKLDVERGESGVVIEGRGHAADIGTSARRQHRYLADSSKLGVPEATIEDVGESSTLCSRTAA